MYALQLPGRATSPHPGAGNQPWWCGPGWTERWGRGTPPIPGAVVATHMAMYADQPELGCVLHIPDLAIPAGA
jgi:hypothetical protein